MMEEERSLKMVGHYSMSQGVPTDCLQCNDAKWGTVLVNDLCLDCFMTGMFVAEISLPCKIYMDGDQWCVLVGENLQEGIAGFGNTPLSALKECRNLIRNSLLV